MPASLPLPPDTELLLLRLDLKTERLLAEAEALIIAIANRQAAIASQEAAAEARRDGAMI